MKVYIFVCVYIYLTENKGVYSLVLLLVQDGNTASPEDFKEVVAEQKNDFFQFLVKQQEDNELSDAVNIGFARFLWHTWKIKPLKHCQLSSQKQTKKKNKTKSLVKCA